MAQNTDMPQAAHHISDSEPAPKYAQHEQPLSERMRTFLRLEFLYQQMLYHAEMDADWATRAGIASLLEIMSILTRGDVRSEVLKELERQSNILRKFQSQPEVDSGRLETLIQNLNGNREAVNAIGPHFLQPLKECEFLSSIKHRSAIPGGTCEFDLPDYSHWLGQPYTRRKSDFQGWLTAVGPICDAILETLWLIRGSSRPMQKTAENGMYQHSMHKDSSCRLLRVLLPVASPYFPEVSGSPQRFTVRFIEWSSVDRKPLQTTREVSFDMVIC